MWATLIPILGQIVLEGMKGWNEKKRTRFKDQYHEILLKLEESISRRPEDWVDSDIDFYEKRLEIFLKAYRDELRNEDTDS